ncbi:phage head closure protein [Melissococcus plutonius]|uniref:phage head closure protein n=1 Tax=Melissococcus plutonius TaxID=33970 RepID=UPI003F5CD91F
MIMVKMLYSKFNKRAQFGSIKTTRNDNTGDNDQVFVPLFVKWCKPQRRTANQSYTIYGTALEGTVVIVIRHDIRVNDKLKVKYDGDIYDIVINSPDDSGGYITYDYLTLRKIKKVG